MASGDDDAQAETGEGRDRAASTVPKNKTETSVRAALQRHRPRRIQENQVKEEGPPPSESPKLPRKPVEKGPNCTVHVIGELNELRNFGGGTLRCEYRVELGKAWKTLHGKDVGKSQASDALPDSDRTPLSHPIDLAFRGESLAGWPALSFRVFRRQPWYGTEEFVSTGMAIMPITPGHHCIVCETWEARGFARNREQELASYLLGASQAPTDPSSIRNRYETPYATRSSGQVVLSLGVLLHGLNTLPQSFAPGDKDAVRSSAASGRGHHIADKPPPTPPTPAPSSIIGSRSAEQSPSAPKGEMQEEAQRQAGSTQGEGQAQRSRIKEILQRRRRADVSSGAAKSAEQDEGSSQRGAAEGE